MRRSFRPHWAKVRTLASFEERLMADLPSVRTIGAIGAPAGLCWVKADELYQLYVASRVARLQHRDPVDRGCRGSAPRSRSRRGMASPCAIETNEPPASINVPAGIGPAT